MITIGGNVCVRNGNSLDYCWKEAVQSLLPVCDVVVICDGESDDGTKEEIDQLVNSDKRIQTCTYAWPNPKGDPDFWVRWLNFGREHIRADFQIQLDADEVLSERSYPAIEALRRRADARMRFSAWFQRYNFWRDAQHLIPHGVCCSHRVVRFAPQNVWLPSDGPNPKGDEAVGMAIESPAEIFHYGFLRERDAFFKKAKALQSYFFNSYDSRLAAAEERVQILEAEGKPGNWMDHCGMEWLDELIPFYGHHPVIMKPWLEQRGLTFI